MKSSSILSGVAFGALILTITASGACAQSWADNTTISGRIYADFTDQTTKVDGVKSGNNGIGIDVKRFYVGIDHKFTDIWAVNVTTDFTATGYTTGSSTTTLDNVYIKKAYLQGTFSPAFTVRIGSADLPWIPYAEDIYGYRYVENTLADRAKFGTSADWGLHAVGKLNDNFSYAVSAVNGNGYKNPTRSKSLDIEGRLSAKFDQLNFAIGGYTGKLGADVQGTATPNTASRFNALAAYSGDQFKFGVEYFSANDYSAALVKSTTTTDKADGYSLFGSYRIDPVYTLFGRAEEVNPSKTLSPTKKDKYYNAGVAYTAFKGVEFSLVAKHDEVTSTGHKTTADEIGIWSQLRY